MKAPFSFLFLLVFVCLSVSNAKAQQAIRFETMKWKSVLEKAKKENKLIFLDAYTSWCGPCKWMEKNVYTNDTVAGFYNSTFICVKIDMEKNEGFDLAKKYNVTAYPTLLYVNASGEVMHRTCGSSSASDLVESGKDALNPEKRFDHYSKKFGENPADPKNAFFYFEQLERACLMTNATIQKYFKTQSNQDLMSFYNWQLIFKYSDYASWTYQNLEANRTAYSKRYTKDSVDLKINAVYATELQRALENRDAKMVKLLKEKLLKLNTKGGLTVVQRSIRKLENNPNADMKKAIPIKDSITGPVNVSKTYGTVCDFYFKDIGLKEGASSWFKLDITYDTLLSFDIVPLDSLDDYDFTVFKCEAGDCIKAVNTSALKPIRICYSYCTSKSGVTGLSPYTTKQTIGAGDGPAYVSSIPVKAGETYYIVVEYDPRYVRKGIFPIGFHIYFHNYWPRKKPIVLPHVLFDHNKSVLTKESFPDLDKLVLQLKKSQMKIEVRGHADNSGNESQNQTLSEERAKAVVDYLISKNIHKDRLFYKGCGSTKPVASNESDEGRRQNRRVEFVMVMN